jgi:imidazolonepropionase-like amidohydrolase
VNLHDAMHGVFGQSRGTAWLRLRELLDDAKAYRANRGGYERRQVRELGASRLDLEVVVRALEGRLPVVFHVDRASDIVTVLALAKEHGLQAVLASAAEGWKVADAIAKAKVPAIVYPLDHGPRSFAALGAREDNAALLHQAGVTLALSTGESHNARKLRQEAGNAVRAGLPKGAALAAVTEAPATILGMAQDYGAPKAGKIANLVVWSGDPFELSTRVNQVIIRGRAVPLRSRQTALLERYR